MKAVRISEYGGPEVLKYEDVAKPKPGKGDALVRIHAAGVNPIDLKLRRGNLKGWLKFTLPVILGYDLSGVVEAAGPGVTKLKKGDEVFGRLDFMRMGAYAEYVLANESEVVKKPKSLDHTQAAAVAVPALAAWQSLFDAAGLSAGETVLIHGAAGGVGHYAVQFARWKGARVLATASGDGLALARELGADEVVDYKSARFEDVARNVDVVLDTIGGETQERSWSVLKKGGILVSVVGIANDKAAAEHGVRAVAVTNHPDAEDLAEIASLVDAGKVKPVVKTVLPLAEARKAHEMIEGGVARGKVVLKVRD